VLTQVDESTDAVTSPSADVAAAADVEPSEPTDVGGSTFDHVDDS
jgi:hypothetical protein